METLSHLFPAAFPALALAHFVALLSPGPDFFLLLGYASRYRLRGSAGLCVGIAAGNGLYIALAILGSQALQQSDLLFRAITLAGAGYLLWIGGHLVRSVPQALSTDTAYALMPGPVRQLLMGFGSAALNPKNALFYLSLMTALLGPDITLLQQTTCGAWMVAAVLVWDLAVAALLGYSRVQRTLNQYVFVVERIAGAVLLVFGAGIALRMMM